jgi:Retrotransposon gag protein/Zinc knuckle
MADVNMNPAQEVAQVPLNVQAYIRSLEAQVAAAQAGQNMGQQRVKPSKPTRFNGAMGSDPTVWLFLFKQYAELSNVAEDQRPKLAATYLDDKAGTWWMHLVSQQPNNNADAITWQMFHDGLLTAFKPVNSKKIARNKLAGLKQTHSVQKYNDEFRTICRDIDDISEAEKLDRYMRGLKPSIRERVELSLPTTVNDAMSKAHTIDSISYYARMSYDSGSNYNYERAAVQSNSDAMDLSVVQDSSNSTDPESLNAMANRPYRPGSNSMRDTGNRGGARSFIPRQQLSQQDFAYCQRNRLCLRCKEPGHIARNCTKPVKPLNLRAR